MNQASQWSHGIALQELSFREWLGGGSSAEVRRQVGRWAFLWSLV